jgi:hypothetical protein
MPFTPYHFGLGAAIKVVAGRFFSFPVFCVSQVFTDIEPGYYLLRGDYPVHRWAHTYVGAAVIGCVTAILIIPIYKPVATWYRNSMLPFYTWIAETRPSLLVTLVSAFVGTFSHVLLDSFMHADMHPFAPFSSANPMLGFLGFRTIQFICLFLGIASFAYATSKSKKA